MKAFKFLSNTVVVVSLALLASCSSEDDMQPSGRRLEFTANIESNEVTRATLVTNDLKQEVHWDDNDQIMVFCDNGEYPGKFSVSPSFNDGKTATFANYEEELPNSFNAKKYYYALYPYVTATFDASTTKIRSVLSASQAVTKGHSCDKNSLIMVASANVDDRIFNFKNVTALVKVNVSGNGNGRVKYIEIAAKNPQNRLSGNFEATVNYNTKELKVFVVSDADDKNKVKLAIPASDESKDFYIAVLPGFVSNGLTFKFENDHETIYELSSDKDLTFVSSKIYNFGSYNVADFPTKE